jgi:hypothetical protein
MTASVQTVPAKPCHAQPSPAGPSHTLPAMPVRTIAERSD